MDLQRIADLFRQGLLFALRRRPLIRSEKRFYFAVVSFEEDDRALALLESGGAPDLPDAGRLLRTGHSLGLHWLPPETTTRRDAACVPFSEKSPATQTLNSVRRAPIVYVNPA